MVPYEQSEKLTTVRKDSHYEIHKRKISHNINRNSLVFLTAEDEEETTVLMNKPHH